MHTKRSQYLILCLIIISLSDAIYAEEIEYDAGQLFQKGLFAEYGEGDLNKAIEYYKEGFKKEYEDDELASKILLRLGICYEKVGMDEDAKDAYQQVVWRFPAQETQSDEATKRLRDLSSGLAGYGYWFRYKGKPMYLIGGGTASIYAGSGLTPEMPITDNPVGGWKAYLDLLTQYRINFVRFYPWDFLNRSQIPDYACPWPMTDDGSSYDLDDFSPKYWESLKEIISYANTRDIIFEIVLFDDDSPWEKHPFNQKRGGALNDRSEYYDLGNARNREYQEKYVAKTITETVEFPAVIYEICDAVGWQNQPLSRTTTNWILHWVNFIDERLPPPSNHRLPAFMEFRR